LRAGYSKAKTKKNRPTADPFLVALDGKKNNQLETVTTFTLETQFGEDGYTQFRVIVVIEPQTNAQTDSGGRLQYTAPQLSVQCNKH